MGRETVTSAEAAPARRTVMRAGFWLHLEKLEPPSTSLEARHHGLPATLSATPSAARAPRAYGLWGAASVELAVGPPLFSARSHPLGWDSKCAPQHLLDDLDRDPPAVRESARIVVRPDREWGAGPRWVRIELRVVGDVTPFDVPRHERALDEGSARAEEDGCTFNRAASPGGLRIRRRTAATRRRVAGTRRTLMLEHRVPRPPRLPSPGAPGRCPPPCCRSGRVSKARRHAGGPTLDHVRPGGAVPRRDLTRGRLRAGLAEDPRRSPASCGRSSAPVEVIDLG